MKTVWTDHVRDEDKEQYRQSLFRVRWVLDDLSNILTKMESGIERNELDPSNYDKVTNWSHKQAHSNGFRQCLRQIKSLIDLGDNNK